MLNVISFPELRGLVLDYLHEDVPIEIPPGYCTVRVDLNLFHFIPLSKEFAIDDIRTYQQVPPPRPSPEPELEPELRPYTPPSPHPTPSYLTQPSTIPPYRILFTRRCL